MMKKFLFVLMAAVAVSTGAFAQKKLSVKDITPELSVYPCQDRPEALVVVRCSEDFELEFKSNVDKELNVVRELEGSEKVYSIVFKTRGEGTSYRGRILTIMAPSFDKVYLPLELKQKEKKEYLVTDPYSSLRSIYYTSVEKANELFTQGMYDQAMDNYRIAKRCPEYETEQNNIDDYLTLCDSMKYWTALVDTAEANNDYYTARDYMLKMMQKNTQCVTLRERFHNIQQAYVTRCNADMANGELYMSDGYYEKARKVYENAVKMRNPRIGEAEAYLHEIEKLTFKKTNKTRVLNYQLLDNTPINFFRAGCKPGNDGCSDTACGCFKSSGENPYKSLLIHRFLNALGKVTAEALSSGTPAVCFNSTANPELIGEGCGAVAAVGNLEDMLSKIRTILSDGKEKYSENCRSFAKRSFEKESNLAVYLEHFEDMANFN